MATGVTTNDEKKTQQSTTTRAPVVNSYPTSSYNSSSYSYSVQKPTAYNPQRDKAYMDAYNALESLKQNTPTYAGTYEGQLKDLYDQIVNRDKFVYDINSDMLYKQYAEQYVNKGRMAMQDTMGQAAALTGGYGSSYGQAVGQQQYDAYLQQLNDVIPELYSMAYDQYNDEGNRMLQEYSMLGDLRDTEYNRYMDNYNLWLTNRDYETGRMDNAYNKGYSAYVDQLNQWNADRNFDYNAWSSDRTYEYNKQQDERNYQFQKQQADRNYQLEMQKLALQQQQAAWERQQALQKQYQPYTEKTATQNVKATYNSGELLEATAAGMSKAQIEQVLKNRGVDINNKAVQADIAWAMKK